MLKKIFSNLFLSLLVACFFTSCALTKDRICVEYFPQSKRIFTQKIQNIDVNVQVIDNRPYPQVGCKKNGFGIEMAPIILRNDLSVIIAEAISKELTNQGFKLGEGDFLLEATIYKFYNDFKNGFFKGQGVAEIIVKFDIRNRQGLCIYSKTVMKTCINNNVYLATGANAKIALDLALSRAIQELFDDPLFLESFLNELELKQ